MLYDILFILNDNRHSLIGSALIICGIILIFLALRPVKKKQLKSLITDIRYADPSHDEKTWVKLPNIEAKRPPQNKQSEYRRKIDTKKTNSIGKQNNPIKTDNIELVTLTQKEAAYFKYQKLGYGWYRLPQKTRPYEAISWIYQNFNPDEFEQFCCAVLSHQNVKNVTVSEKRSSGADGGIDGLGQYLIDDKDVKIVFQAKRYKLGRQVKTNEVRDFIGAMLLNDIQYGFFITTSIFSDRSKKESEMITQDQTKPIHLELIDQDKLIECLLYRSNSIHGFGLHKTDELGFYYLNPNMLRKAIEKY